MQIGGWPLEDIRGPEINLMLQFSVVSLVFELVRKCAKIHKVKGTLDGELNKTLVDQNPMLAA